MSFDRSDPDEHADRRHEVPRSLEQAPDTQQARLPADVGSTADGAEGASFRLPSAAERIEAHRQARQAADATYATSNRDHADAEGKSGQPRRPGTAVPADRATSSPDPVAGPPDKPPATEEALRKRVSELEADKAARDRQSAAQDAKLAGQAKVIAEQGHRIDRLEAYAGRITTAVSELRQQGERQPGTEIAERDARKERIRAAPEHSRRIPSDVTNGVMSFAATSAVADYLAFNMRDQVPEYANLGATAFGLAVGIIAMRREHRKAKDDADH